MPLKKNAHPLITGTLILTAAAALSRVIGFFYKIFLSRTIGAEGIGIYQMIFPIYGVCYALTTAGAEIAVARFVSREAGGADRGRARTVLRIGLLLSLPAAMLTSFLLWKNADVLALRVLKEARCGELLRILALTVPFGACHSCVCGYYYGRKKAGIPAAAQLFEQLTRVGAVFLLFRIAEAEGRTLTPKAAVIGLVLGELAAMLFGLFSIANVRPPRSRRTSARKGGSPEAQGSGRPSPAASTSSTAALAADMFRLSLPVTGNRLCMNLLSSAEATLLPLMLQRYGLDTEQALSVYGTLTGMSMSFILFPSVLTNAVSVMLLPAVSESQAAGAEGRLARTVRRTVAFCVPLGIAFLLIFLVFGKFLGRFFFQSELAGDFIITLAWICPFLYLNGTLHSILNGLGRTAAGFFNNLTGILIRIFFVLAFVPRIGIQGYLWGILANQLFAAALNLRALREYL